MIMMIVNMVMEGSVRAMKITNTMIHNISMCVIILIIMDHDDKNDDSDETQLAMFEP